MKLSLGSGMCKLEWLDFFAFKYGPEASKWVISPAEYIARQDDKTAQNAGFY